MTTLKVTVDITGTIHIEKITPSNWPNHFEEVGKIRFTPATWEGTIGKAVGLIRKYIDDDKLVAAVTGESLAIDLVINADLSMLSPATMVKLRKASKGKFPVRFAAYGDTLRSGEIRL